MSTSKNTVKSTPVKAESKKFKIARVNLARDKASDAMNKLRLNVEHSSLNTRASSLILAVVNAILVARDTTNLRVSPRLASDLLSIEGLTSIVKRSNPSFKKVSDEAIQPVKSYLASLSGYQESAGAVQSSDTISHHAFSEHRARSALERFLYSPEKDRTRQRNSERKFKHEQQDRSAPDLTNVRPVKAVVFANAKVKVEKTTYVVAGHVAKAEWVVQDKATGNALAEPFTTFHEAKDFAEKQ